MAKLFHRDEFSETFAEHLSVAEVEGEPFWLLRKESGDATKALIETLTLDESFREQYEHDYLPEP